MPFELRKFKFKERQKKLVTKTLEKRETRGDMITTYKIFRVFDKADRERLL